MAEVELQPGALLMHEDDAYYHYVTPLKGDDSHAIYRAALILMIRPSF